MTRPIGDGLTSRWRAVDCDTMLDGLVHRALTCFFIRLRRTRWIPFVVKQQERERGDGASDQSRQSSVLDPDRMPDEEELESAFEMFVVC